MFTQVTIDNLKNYKGDKATVNFRFICIPSIFFFFYIRIHASFEYLIYDDIYFSFIIGYHAILVMINSFKYTQQKPGFSSYNLNQKFILQMKTVIINPLNLELVFVYTEHIHISLLI